MQRFARLSVLAALLVVPLSLAWVVWANEPFPEIRNTQAPGEHPPTPTESLELLQLPEGFSATLFAGEPDVQQPIAFAFDDRGRIWVVENYTYTGRGFTREFRDRVVILEDSDNDGVHDRRTVFWDQGWVTTGIELGFGGVWLLDAGRLIFLPWDGDRDTPSGEPVVMVDGFEHDRVGHNIVNGLMWGPDGWLYGRHGIQATSEVGPPGTPASGRTVLNCSIWRFHPQRHTFEVVCHGTTNPWGLDYDEHGQFFFTNNVIGHLWHVVPGAHYRRMYGEDFNPHVYELIDQTADHYHWDASGAWHASRLGTADKYGGGHSHCGGMIYLGDNWPDQYYGQLFMGNVHGRRVNMDRLERDGCSYIGRHEPDFLRAGEPWFRAVELKYGPDGAVYVSDWSDLGECHDHDGVHRTSGRLYKITYGDAQPHPLADVTLSELPADALVDLLGHRNEWFARKALRLLHEHHVAQTELVTPRRRLAELVEDPRQSVSLRLRALWALNLTGGVPGELLARCATDENEHLRVWAIRLFVDHQPVESAPLALFAELAANDPSGLVRLTLASALQRLAPADRWPIATALVQHAEDAQDRVQPLMLWYGIEAAVGDFPDEALQVVAASKIPLVQQFVARRLTFDLASRPQPVQRLVGLLSKAEPSTQREVLAGMVAATRGWRKATPPDNWNQVAAALAQADDEDLVRWTRELSVVFGDGRAVDELLKIAHDNNQAPGTRASALEVLVESRTPGLEELLNRLVNERTQLSTVAIRGLAVYDVPDATNRILNNYRRLTPEGRRAAIETLASREASAKRLMDAVASGSVPRDEITAADARQLAALGSEAIVELLEKHWGSVRQTPQERRELIETFRQRYTPEVLAEAELSSGRAVYKRVCANCHRLYDDGGTIGPDITGAGRSNLTYLLENILDPSAAVAKEFRTSHVLLSDGRLLSGVVMNETPRTLELQTAERRLVLERDDVDEIVATTQSLMPDGLLEPLSAEQIRDLLGYLMHPHQVPLPEEEEDGSR